MRKLFFLPVALAAFLLTGCFDTVQEITLNDDGGGNLVTKYDLSAVLSMASQMGGGADLEKAGEKKVDTTISLEEIVEKLSDLKEEEKKIVGQGSLRVNMDLKNGVFVTWVSFPFSKTSEIPTLNRLSNKILSEALKGQAGDMSAAGLDEMPEISSVDDYYKFDFTEGELTRKVDDDKYAGVESDEYLKGLRDAAGMGMNVKNTYVINLPRPAQKVDGRNAVLSDDGMKVTVTADINDFFGDASVYAFKIKY